MSESRRNSLGWKDVLWDDKEWEIAKEQIILVSDTTQQQRQNILDSTPVSALQISDTFPRDGCRWAAQT
jgi:hypothetical protein